MSAQFLKIHCLNNLKLIFIRLERNIINLLLKGVYQILIVALYHEKLPD